MSVKEKETTHSSPISTVTPHGYSNQPVIGSGTCTDSQQGFISITMVVMQEATGKHFSSFTPTQIAAQSISASTSTQQKNRLHYSRTYLGRLGDEASK
ncbi:uncharacterized protein V6R79_024438 [Siganus canaliculatus]